MTSLLPNQHAIGASHGRRSRNQWCVERIRKLRRFAVLRDIYAVQIQRSTRALESLAWLLPLAAASRPVSSKSFCRQVVFASSFVGPLDRSRAEGAMEVPSGAGRDEAVTKPPLRATVALLEQVDQQQLQRLAGQIARSVHGCSSAAKVVLRSCNA
eukprot:scaffold361_cov248-Pinguiococcus_pyrenoidosus.AAC.17